MKTERLREAVLYLAAAAGLGTNDYRARYLLSQALDLLEQREDAIKQLEIALDLNKNYRSARELLAKLRQG